MKKENKALAKKAKAEAQKKAARKNEKKTAEPEAPSQPKIENKGDNSQNKKINSDDVFVF